MHDLVHRLEQIALDWNRLTAAWQTGRRSRVWGRMFHGSVNPAGFPSGERVTEASHCAAGGSGAASGAVSAALTRQGYFCRAWSTLTISSVMGAGFSITLPSA